MSTPMMDAAIVRAFGAPLDVGPLPVPTPGPGQVLVRMEATGVCHTDLHAARGDWPIKPRLPFVPGHEGVGIIDAVGDDVALFQRGDRVGVAWLHSACGHCEYCVGGWETLCEAQTNTGYSVNGTFAEYALAQASHVVPLPEEPDAAILAPLLCAGVTTYKGIRETEARPGQCLVVSGLGGLGHLAVQYGVAMGLRVFGVDISPDKLALAERLGAEGVFDGNAPGCVEQVRRATRGGGHGVLVTAVSPSAFSQSIGMARRGGTIALVGLPPGEFNTPIFDLVLRRVTLRGSIVGTRNDLREAVSIAMRAGIRPHLEVHRLHQINDVFARLHRGHVNGRVVIRFE